jgi:ElaB/YqjD/DUF883 family membrane-anchored ribosome-binding protein
MSTERYEGSTSPAGAPGSSMPPRGGAPSAPSSGTATSVGATADNLADQAKQTGQHLADQAKQQGQHLADSVGQTTEHGMDKAADAAEGLADTIRDKAQSLPGDKTTDLAYQAADSLERGASYVRDADVERMRGDFESMIRKYPVQSIAVGLAAGFLLARLFR